MDYVFSQEVSASPAQLWRRLIDIENWPRISESVLQVERLDTGAFGVGSRARVTQPKQRPTVWTVTELIDERSFTWEASTSGLRMIAGHELRPSGAGTTLTLSFALTGPLRRVAALLAGSRITRYVQMELAGLTHAAEQDAAGGQAPAADQDTSR